MNRKDLEEGIICHHLDFGAILGTLMLTSTLQLSTTKLET